MMEESQSMKNIGFGTKIKVLLLEYQLKERIGGFTIMELFGPLLVIAIIIGIIQY
jgi:hypothetical protein